MKDTGKSSSRKLRRVVYYLLYKMDPQKTHYEIGFSTKMLKNPKSRFFFIFSPLTPIALRRGLCINRTLPHVSVSTQHIMSHIPHPEEPGPSLLSSARLSGPPKGSEGGIDRFFVSPNFRILKVVAQTQVF